MPAELQGGRLNSSLTVIDYTVVRQYFSEKLDLIRGETSAEHIFNLMAPFYELCGIQIPLPLIKKYKNCLYFGENRRENRNSKAESYEGFLLFSQEKKLYYGELLKEKKNGRGTEIDFASDTVYKGHFQGGKKSGEFTVIKPA